MLAIGSNFLKTLKAFPEFGRSTITRTILGNLPRSAKVQLHAMSSKVQMPDKKLFTPGPLTTSKNVKEAMLRDLGSRDTEFVNTVKYIRESLMKIAGVSSEKYTAIPLQGSGTYAIEGVLQTAVPRKTGKVFILANGAYGKRMDRICEVADIQRHMLMFPEDTPVDLEVVEKHLKENNSYNLVAIVHCETSSGVLNNLTKTKEVIRRYVPKAAFFVDAMSSFGAVPIDMENKIDYLVSSANKCLEGVPGFSFVIARKQHLLNCKGNSRTLSLDLVDQFLGLEGNGQFRFTAATHTMLAFKRALEEFEKEGGVAGRAERYKQNCAIVRSGLKRLGFRELVDPANSGYVISTFYVPSHPNFSFTEFYSRLNELGQVIYPGKVTNADCFRIGNIGQLFPEDMKHLIKCIEQVCKEMKVVLV